MGAASPAMWAGLVLVVLLAASGPASAGLPRFAEAPEYRNGDGCPAPVTGAGVCDPGLVHIAMTLDAHYLRGSMAAIYSLLKHASCPESIFFHFLLPVPALRDLPVPRRRGRRAHLRVRARRARGAAQLRAQPPRRPAPALRAARDIPRLRRARRRRRAAPLGDAPARRRGRRRARVLPRQLLPLLHRGLLGRPRPRRQGLCRPPPRALLLQHRRHGHRPPEVARWQLPPAHRALDGDAEGEKNLRAWLLAPLPARLRRRDRGRRPPVEPARPGRRQRLRQLPPSP
uniref:Uncharacterized protein n=1 Tax=Zea mays TaxID=4577 RepID=C4IYN2_MAIZE|nr:unknown [Zea mays]